VRRSLAGRLLGRINLLLLDRLEQALDTFFTRVLPLFTHHSGRTHVLCWKCPLCPFATEKRHCVYKHLLHKHHLDPEQASKLRYTSTRTYRDLPPKRHYVLSNAGLARLRTHRK
jgi:hypothetical protein